MRKFLVVLVLALLLGCTQGQEKSVKHLQSDIFGLHRRVTWYAPDGKRMVWEGTFKVEIEGAWASFIINNKEVKVSGQATIEEL